MIDWQCVDIEHEGKCYSALMAVINGKIEVHHPILGASASQRRDLPALSVARLMLREMVIKAGL